MDADREALLQAVIDQQLEIERKARAWEELEHLAATSTDPAAPLVVDLMRALVHPARSGSTC